MVSNIFSEIKEKRQERSDSVKSPRINGKKGYVYFIEIIIIVVLLVTVFTGFIESEQHVFKYKQQENMREIGYGVLHNLDELDVLDTALIEKNFTQIERYVSESISPTEKFDLDYLNTSCYSVSDTLSSAATSCDWINASTENEVISTYYTYFENGTAHTLRIYLWRIL